MTSPEDHPSKSPRERLALDAIDNYVYRFASRDEANELALLFEKAFIDSGFGSRGIRYSAAKAEAWLRDAIMRGSCPHLVALKDDAIVGAISYALDETFCEKPVAVMHMLYVEPAHRRTAVGKVLVALCADAARNDGAVAFHAPIAAQVREQSLVNLFGHAGFEPIGTIVGRSL
jgi:GNAT superfamily N-acetyltransferase